MNAHSTFSIILRKPIYTSARSITTARFAPDTPGNTISRKICDKRHTSKDEVVLSSHSGDLDYSIDADESAMIDLADDNGGSSKGNGRTTITLQWRLLRTEKSKWRLVRWLSPKDIKWRTAEFSILDEEDLGGGATVVFGKDIASEMGVVGHSLRARQWVNLNLQKVFYTERVSHMKKHWSKFRRKAQEKGIM